MINRCGIYAPRALSPPHRQRSRAPREVPAPPQQASHRSSPGHPPQHRTGRGPRRSRRMRLEDCLPSNLDRASTDRLRVACVSEPLPAASLAGRALQAVGCGRSLAELGPLFETAREQAAVGHRPNVVQREAAVPGGELRPARASRARAPGRLCPVLCTSRALIEASARTASPSSHRHPAPRSHPRDRRHSAIPLA